MKFLPEEREILINISNIPTQSSQHGRKFFSHIFHSIFTIHVEHWKLLLCLQKLLNTHNFFRLLLIYFIFASKVSCFMSRVKAWDFAVFSVKMRKNTLFENRLVEP